MPLSFIPSVDIETLQFQVAQAMTETPEGDKLLLTYAKQYFLPIIEDNIKLRQFCNTLNTAISTATNFAEQLNLKLNE